MEPRSSAEDATSGSEIQRSDAKDRSSMNIELQPETRPISLSQLVNEVKGIYVGLVMVETKCIEVDSEKGGVGSNPQTKFTDEQWQALITLHRTLLHEHHDFMLASQHPSASPALRRLAVKYAMPARMWRHGIHSFLELLRHRLPDSQEHMITFIYLAYSMMALLYETVPAFEDTWVECLGDLSRYRMAIEDDNQRVRDTWTQVSAGWYTIASNHAPTTGRLYHHLAILARPQIVTQLYLYLKSLCVPVPFSSTNESILTLLDPILNNKPPAGVSELEVLFVTLHAILFTGKSNSSFATISAKFLKALDSHITTGGKSLIETGVYIAIINICAVLGFGADNNVLMKLLRQPKTSSTNAIDGTSNADLRSIEESSSAEPPSRAQALTTGTDRIIFSRFGVESLYGYIHARLVWLVEMAQLPGAMICLERHVDWALLVDYLNDLIGTYNQYERLEMDTVMIAPSGSNDNVEVHPRQIPGRTPETSTPNNSETGPRALSGASEVKATDAPTPTIAEPPRPRSVEERPLPEDWKHRGMIYAQNTFPRGWFGDFGAVDDGERLMETPAMTKIRKERILWLAVRLTKFSTNIVYDKNTHLFSVGEYAADKSIARGKEDDEGGQDDEDDDINLSDMESLAYSANLNIKSTDSVLDHISIKR
ncbi:hypothetical protein CMQ_2277 [Grosmannia clavigera kw1407]|uniref:DNA/RNA-binding domain-containing protein n=1 Tax=Grosmannia clavigera (strain kw1407 / UAMH 11150) TaxID=655863 RepID=F0XJ77_GROCL|nr:uncharacterized protein CMQ_2277 [Grosmannia clavigera kw1407]EFX02228.1 hypothetical protein CMQ_2277 [Grosmannia clavigera kw1407]